jgi:serine/threonine protein phosphatase PrpC
MGCDHFLGEDITIFRPNHSFGWGTGLSLDSEQDANDSISKCQDVSIDIEEPDSVIEMSQLPTLRLSSSSTAHTQEDIVNQVSVDVINAPKTEEKKSTGENYCFIYGAHSIPKDCRVGEDAYFVTSRALGVADGVSGWSKYGISSCDFSRQIMDHCETEVRKGMKGDVDLFNVLTKAHEKSTAPGSSTVSMIAINGQTMVGLNLGDSGFVCFTKMNNLYVSNGVSKEQQHDFNTPFQLTRLPPENIPNEGEMGELREIIAQGRLCIDPVSAADRYTLPIHKDDIVVLGTDGKLYDEYRTL